MMRRLSLSFFRWFGNPLRVDVSIEQRPLIIKPPFLRFLMALGFFFLIALGFRCEDALGFAMLAFVLVIFAILAFAMEYIQRTLSYSDRCNAALKEALREEITSQK